MHLIPISIREAKAFITEHHRHNKAPAGAKFAIGVQEGDHLVGVAMVGRPISAGLQDGFTAEVLRVCTIDPAPKNACSMLYGASWRAWKAMGGTRIVTYTLKREEGTSVKAAGWLNVAETRPATWHIYRERKQQNIYSETKYRWENKVA